MHAKVSIVFLHFSVLGARKAKSRSASLAQCFRTVLVHQGTGAEESEQSISFQNEAAHMNTSAMKRGKKIPPHVLQGIGVKRRETSFIPPPRKTNAVGDFGVRRKQNPLNIYHDC